MALTIVVLLFLFIAGFAVYYAFSNVMSYTRINSLENRILVQKDFTGVLEQLEEMVQKLPGNPKVHYLYAEALAASGKLAAAIIEYNQVLRMKNYEEFTAELQLHRKLAMIYIEQQKYEEAEKELLQCAKNTPDSPLVYTELGDIFGKSDSREHLLKALKYYSKAYEAEPERAGLLEKIISAAWKTENYTRVKECASVILSKNESNPAGNFYLGKIFIMEEDYLSALKYFSISRRSREYQEESELALGVCYYYSERFEEGIENIESYLARLNKEENFKPLPASILSAKYYLGLCYEGMRNYEMAMKYWLEVYAQNSSYQNVAEKIDAFKYIMQDDLLKEILAGSMTDFRKNAAVLLEKLEFIINSVEELNKETLQISASKNAMKKFQLGAKGDAVIFFSRSDKPISENSIVDLIDAGKKRHCSNLYYFSFSDFFNDAKKLAESRSVIIINKDKLNALVKSEN
ncbi:MAG: hypothetical protein A2096_08755 [Spirochaetes bacterium GWF1_41_5]|nr:MAG: hypothetical protein A2096_08755 [Spirochaetes bacterium GWF1_41_5]HBE02468.1 hypothetical protein [Spirochaetia bacterium]